MLGKGFPNHNFWVGFWGVKGLTFIVSSIVLTVMPASLARYSLSGAIGVAVGVVGTLAIRQVVRWWCSRHRGSAVETNLQGRHIDQQRKLKLYHSYPFRSLRCAWLVNELGVTDQVSFQHVKLHGSDARDLMAYREVHPHGTLPSLMLEDGSVLLESSAICLYLAECFVCSSGENLLPESENTAEYYK